MQLKASAMDTLKTCQMLDNLPPARYQITIPTMITGEIGLDAWEYASFLFNKGDNRDMSLLNACSDIWYSLLKCCS